ncbi:MULTISPECIES: ribosome hibernation-promoting factor, HPF/YfiA family [Shewanella]|uniref:Ribosomal subunit interface protein n=1 Tax=Shewanella carassii TaxID=1987584 RepID=A0ABQ1T1N0_9GAMM|nr:ribosome-associated translation inhibitor RaiA [Shewanella carassii]BCV65792.1 ribosomal subunit interface protein [Shewanella carassii]GGE75083.1 ribosomal subunit interface protein [Shewanella carassii]
MLKITSKQFEVTAAIRERVESRLAKLDRYDTQLINPHVIILTEGPLFKIEASIKLANGQLFAQAKHENLYAAINAMGQKLEKQLNRLTHKPAAQRGALETEATEPEFEYDYKEDYAA